MTSPFRWQADNVFIGTALRESLARGYRLSDLRADLLAGFIVSLVALPLAMALAIAVGLPPQHGIYTAIVAGIAAAVFGGSATQVSGPTAAFVVIVAPIVSAHGLHGLIWCQLLAGAILIFLGALRLGRLVRYVPYPVTTGFTAGIALVIATLALNDFLGLGIGRLEGDYIDKLAAIAGALPGLNRTEALVGIFTLGVMLLSGRYLKILPGPIVGIAAGALLAFFLNRHGVAIETIATRFTYDGADGQTWHGIPPYPPVFHAPGEGGFFQWPTRAETHALLMPAFVVAALAALESLLSATVADRLKGTRHNPDAELNGIGIANILSALAAGIPATGAIARTATNIQSGGRTPLAAVFHALLLLLYVLVLAPLINFMPMASLAALLLLVAARMSHLHEIKRLLRITPLSDRVVLISCFLLTVFIDMVAGVMIGIVIAALLFMARAARLTTVMVRRSEGTLELVVRGPLFFGTAEKLRNVFFEPEDGARTLVLNLEDVPLIDATGLLALRVFLDETAARVIIVRAEPSIERLLRRKLAHTALEGRVSFAGEAAARSCVSCTESK